MIPTSPLPIHTPLMPNQSIEVSLPLNTIGPVMKMDPLNNLQVPQDLFHACKCPLSELQPGWCCHVLFHFFSKKRVLLQQFLSFFSDNQEKFMLLCLN